MLESRTTATLKAIPSGSLGTRATLREMAKLVRQYRKTIPIRELALGLLRNVPGHKNFKGQVQSLRDYVHEYIQYVRDVNGVETLQTPTKTLEYGQGDCDDQATLLASLLESVGFRTRFVAIKVDATGPFCHVYTEVSFGRGWMPVETTERWPIGTRPPRIAGSMIENI
jgi:transglutaminase-like putative cysteine protease